MPPEPEPVEPITRVDLFEDLPQEDTVMLDAQDRMHRVMARGATQCPHHDSEDVKVKDLKVVYWGVFSCNMLTLCPLFQHVGFVSLPESSIIQAEPRKRARSLYHNDSKLLAATLSSANRVCVQIHMLIYVIRTYFDC